MNHGRLGYISGHSLRLPPDILDQLGLRLGNVLFGVYYPRNKSRVEYRKATVDDDFMLTPLFPHLWDRAGCFIVRVKHEPQSFATIARFLAEEGLSIYCSEFTRSGYRYGTWNIHAVVNGLPEKLKYAKRRSGYPKAIEFLESAKRRMLKICKKVLFVDRTEPDLQEPVRLLHLSALSYFAHHCSGLRKDSPPSLPFRLRVGKEGYLKDEQGEFSRVLERIKEQFHRDLKDSVFFVEADRRNYNMRLAVFSGERRNNLFVARARYKTSGNWNEFRGLLARISTNLPKSCNIWKCSNEKLAVEKDYETGIIKMVVDYNDDGIERATKIREIVECFTKPSAEFAPKTQVEDPHVRPATLAYCHKRIAEDYARAREEEPLVFISYQSRQRANATRVRSLLKQRKIHGWLDNKDLARGEWADQIRKALNRTHAFILLWTPGCHKSEWVNTEWIYAVWFGIPMTIFLVRGKPESLPEQLQKYHAVSFHNVKERNAALDNIAKDIHHAVLTRVD